jgi:hypothetical protein
MGLTLASGGGRMIAGRRLVVVLVETRNGNWGDGIGREGVMARSPEEVEKDWQDVQKQWKGDLERQGLVLSGMMANLVRTKGEKYGVDWMMEWLKEKTADEIQQMSLAMKPEMVKLLAPRLLDDERFQ